METSCELGSMTEAIIKRSGDRGRRRVGFEREKPIQPTTQLTLKIVVGVLGIWLGVKLAWSGINGSVGQIAKELGIDAAWDDVGKIDGQIMPLAKVSNAVGKYAGAVLAAPSCGRGVQREASQWRR